MRELRLSVSELISQFSTYNLLDTYEGQDVSFDNISPVESCNKTSLVFVSDESFVERAIAARPAVIVTHPDLVENFAALDSAAVITCANVKLAQALIRQALDDRDFHASEWGDRHKSAVVHETASIGDNTVIGPGVVIGRDCTIGDNTVVMANTVIEHDVDIGRDCVIHPNVVISYGCKLGNKVMVKSGATIGMEGFGFAQDTAGKSYRVPQSGTVIIEDDVVVGPSCNIDRATYGETRIQSGSVLDALCHIAHNVNVGENCIIIAQTGLAGSVTLGKRNIISGQTAITDHVYTVDDVILLHKAGVMSSVERPGAYAGIPVQPLKEYFKNVAFSRRLGELNKRIKQLEKHLDIKEE